MRTGRPLSMLPPSPDCMVCEPDLIPDPPWFLRPRTEERKRIMSRAKPGDRVRLLFCDDQWTKLTPGTKGTVSFVDIRGTVHVKWDDGSSLGLIPGVDSFQIVTEPPAPDAARCPEPDDPVRRDASHWIGRPDPRP